jgi:NTE family protein
LPFGSEGIQPGVALALSGGGFRATLFHCGVLWRLNQLGMLEGLTRISSVSGGSIAAGRLAVRWDRLRFVNHIAQDLGPEVMDPLREFCQMTVDGPAIVEGVLVPFQRTSDVLERAYRPLFQHPTLSQDATLRDLPDTPHFVFTNLGTGVDFRFSKPYAGDYRIGLWPTPVFPIARAVAASSAFPPFLSPLVIEPENPDVFQATDGADLHAQRRYRERILLTDGGAYDNLGLETVWTQFETVLVSDAGAPFRYEVDPAHDWFRQTLGVLDLTVNQARGLRKRRLIDLYQAGARTGAYWGIMTDLAGYAPALTMPVRPEIPDQLASIRSRLNPFNAAEQGSLINWGYAVCDAAIRRWVQTDIPLPTAWPDPRFPLDHPSIRPLRSRPRSRSET